MQTLTTSEKSRTNAVTSANKNKQQPFFSPLLVQPKLSVGASDDPMEREADAMADRILRMSDQSVSQDSFFKPHHRFIQRKCTHCEEEEKIQRITAGSESGEIQTPSLVNEVLSSGGKPLDQVTRNFFEPRFGYDFSNVKIHTGGKAADSSEMINANAYTFGNNIVFNENRFAPQTDSGKKLLAHELTHIVQQGNAKVRPLVQRDEVERTMSDKWPDYIIRHIQRALRNHKLYTGYTTGKLDQQTVDGLNKVFYKDSWKNYDHKAVLGILTSKDSEWLIKNKPDEATLNKAKEIKMPDCDLAKGEFLLKVEEDLTKSKCILQTDPILNKYIDNNIADFNAQLLPDTNMFNISHDRITSFRAIYKDGTRVDFSPKDLPKSKTRSGSVQTKFLFDYELKKDGKVYPVRAGRLYLVDFSVPTLSYLNGELHRSVDYVIVELRKHGQLIELGAGFAKLIAALGGMASFNKVWVDHFSKPYTVRSGQRLDDLDIPPHFTTSLKAKNVPDAFKEIVLRMSALKRNKVMRAKLFEELKPQMKKFDRHWGADRVDTTDGSIMYLGLKGFALVIDNNGRIFRGHINNPAEFVKVSKTKVVRGVPLKNEFTADYTPVYGKLTEIDSI
jgi:hypothetical protein